MKENQRQIKLPYIIHSPSVGRWLLVLLLPIYATAIAFLYGITMMIIQCVFHYTQFVAENGPNSTFLLLWGVLVWPLCVYVVYGVFLAIWPQIVCDDKGVTFRFLGSKRFGWDEIGGAQVVETNKGYRLEISLKNGRIINCSKYMMPLGSPGFLYGVSDTTGRFANQTGLAFGLQEKAAARNISNLIKHFQSANPKNSTILPEKATISSIGSVILKEPVQQQQLRRILPWILVLTAIYFVRLMHSLGWV